MRRDLTEAERYLLAVRITNLCAADRRAGETPRQALIRLLDRTLTELAAQVENAGRFGEDGAVDATCRREGGAAGTGD